MRPIYILFFFAALIVSACSKDAGTADAKKTQLAELKKQREEIDGKIKTLEKELKTMGDTSASDQKVKDIAVTPVAQSNFNHYIDVQGKIDSDKNVQVSPETPGIIQRVNVQLGDKVRKGQVLAELDGSVLAQSIEEVKAQAAFANTMYEKQKGLWEQKVGTEVQYLSAKNNKESLDNRLSTLQRQYAMTRVKSPIDGTIDEVRSKQGESAMPGMPIFRVVNLSEFKVVAEVAEAYFGEINVGDDVVVNLPDAGQDIKGKVTDKTNVIDAMNRTFKIEVALKGQNMALRPNMIAKVKINDYTNKAAIIVPVNTVQESDQGKYVYLAEKDGKGYKVKKQFVKTGKSYLDKVEIAEGLKQGDLLITAGFQDLTAGQQIKF
ncbi:MAG: efflux RND transporter periplasmic adaptor subunit [Cytophagaceae bacterium]